MITEIKNIIKGEVLVDAATLAKYSRDASLFEIKPKVVVCPKDADDIRALVRFAAAQKQPGQKVTLTPRSGGTDMTGGPLSESVVLDMTRYFNRIKEIGADYAVVEPGVYYRDFEKATLARNLLLPCFPASRELCTVGGMVANNAGGEKTLSYGQTVDYVKKLKAVLADGQEYEFGPLNQAELEAKIKQDNFEGRLYREIYTLVSEQADIIAAARPKVSKNSSGYYLWRVWDGQIFDLTKLLVGSQGTLGIITEITFKLVQPKPYARLLVVFLKDLTNLGQIDNVLLAHKPETIESYDDHTLKLALKFIPGFVKRLGGNVISLGLKFLPELAMVLTGGVPKLVLIAEFTGDSQAEVDRRAREAQSALAKFELKTRLARDAAEAEKYKVIRRESFSLLREKVRGRQTAPFIDDIVVRPEFLPEFLPKLEEILSRYEDKMIYTIAGHAGDGDFHIIPLMNLSDPEARRIIPELAQKVYDLVFEYHGSMSGEHNDGLIRGPYLRQMFGEEVYKLFVEVKNIFDPQNILNPGKKVNVSLQYAVDHFKKGR